MASSGNLNHLWFAVALITLSLGGCMAQSGCTNVIIGMASCLNFVTANSKTPSSSCCSSLANVVKSQPQCLCTALDGSTLSSLGITINKTVALTLPSICNVKTPPVSRCNAANNAPVLPPVAPPENSQKASNGPSPPCIC